jgi:hypothetical protein
VAPQAGKVNQIAEQGQVE